MKLFCRDNKIEEFHADDALYDEASIHLCSGKPGEWRCEIRVVHHNDGNEEIIWRDECDNELCLEDCNLVRDDE